MKKIAPKFVDEKHVQVTKEFAKNSRIFGTPEYKLWKEIRMDCPDAEMVTKNMTYERMAIYIREQKDAKTLMIEFEKQIALS